MRRAIIYLFLIALTGPVIAQEDSIKVKHKTMEFHLSKDYTEMVQVPLDTLITGNQDHRIVDRHTPFYTSLGNYGLAISENDFFKRTIEPDDFLYRHLKPYMHLPENSLFVDTQVPYTELKFTFGGSRQQAEQTFGVRHSQNVNPRFNLGLDLDIVNSLGQYSYQKADDKVFSLHTSYTGLKYNMFISGSLNNFTFFENGGVTDIELLKEFETRDVPVNLGGLNEAQTILNNKNLLLVQKYIISGKKRIEPDTLDSGNNNTGGLKGTFTHILILENNKRSYFDKYPEGGFYDTVFIQGASNTFDSLYSRVLKNTLRFDFRTRENAKVSLGIGVGIRNELNTFYQVMPTGDTLNPIDSLHWTHSSNALTGKIFNRIGKKFGWEAQGDLYFSGLKTGDFIINGRIFKTFNEGEKKSELFVRGSIENTGPSWWLNKWGSSHFIWNNDFGKEFRLNVGGGFEYPGRSLSLELDYALIDNYLYFNELAMPDQMGASLSVLSARVNKVFKFWKFHSANRILIQQSSNTEVLDLPLISVKSSFYFDHEFYFESTGGRLQFQIGVEAFYNSSYYAYAFMPSTGVFYNQNAIKTGNYPYLNAFANLKLKRTRLFVAFEHINSGYTGYNYIMSPGYPMNIRRFKYGVAWTFYN